MVNFSLEGEGFVGEGGKDLGPEGGEDGTEGRGWSGVSGEICF